MIHNLFDTDDDFRPGRHDQQSFSELLAPERSNHTNDLVKDNTQHARKAASETTVLNLVNMKRSFSTWRVYSMVEN